jgi:hypothetical protein
MPRIQWTGLPPALRDHLFDRLRKRKITAARWLLRSLNRVGTLRFAHSTFY